MQEGKLVHRDVVTIDGYKFYVEKVKFPDWHKGIHGFYVNMDYVLDGRKIVDQRSDYNDFCNFTVQYEDCTITMLREIECIVLVKSFTSMPVAEFDRMVSPLLV